MLDLFIYILFDFLHIGIIATLFGLCGFLCILELLKLASEVEQKDVYAQCAQGYVEEFTKKNGRNSMVFAYGQTGTGKTHTMFGPPETLKQGCEDSEEWGIFPKVVANTLKKVGENSNIKAQLQISAVEFYLCVGFDLLNNH